MYISDAFTINNDHNYMSTSLPFMPLPFCLLSHSNRLNRTLQIAKVIGGYQKIIGKTTLFILPVVQHRNIMVILG